MLNREGRLPALDLVSIDLDRRRERAQVAETESEEQDEREPQRGGQRDRRRSGMLVGGSAASRPRQSVGPARHLPQRPGGE